MSMEYFELFTSIRACCHGSRYFNKIKISKEDHFLNQATEKRIEHF